MNSILAGTADDEAWQKSNNSDRKSRPRVGVGLPSSTNNGDPWEPDDPFHLNSDEFSGMGDQALPNRNTTSTETATKEAVRIGSPREQERSALG